MQLMVCLLMETFAQKFAAHQNMHSQEQENVSHHVLLGIIETQKIMVMEMELS